MRVLPGSGNGGRILAALAMALTLGACSATPRANPAGSPASSGSIVGAATPTLRPTPLPSETLMPTPAAWPSQAPLKPLWEAHGPVTDRTSTTSVAIDPLTGNLWVGVPFENRFWIFKPNGKYLESWGQAGTGDGELDLSDHAQKPDGFAAIAFAPDGSYYVGDTGNHRVEQFDAHRRFVRAWGSFGNAPGQFVQITSIATNGDLVYVGDGERYDIQEFKADGTFVRSFAEDRGYTFLVLDHQGLLRASNPQNPVGATIAVAEYDSSGTLRWELPISATDAWPIQGAVDAVGNLYVPIEQSSFPFRAEGILKVDPSGTVTAAWQGGGDAVRVSPSGDVLYVVRGGQLDGTQWASIKAFSLSTH
jgi:hypothetical protein